MTVRVLRPETAPFEVKLVARDVRVEYFDETRKDLTLALERVDLDVRTGEFLTIVGPSGCGKTTFINAVDGLLPLSGGVIFLDGVPVGAPGPDRAMVFQASSLLPWRTVLGNVTYGMECQRIPREEMQRRATRMVDLVGLTGFENHYPNQLSGGMQQRTNLARALAVDPQILLMDEPFAALDAQTRELMQVELLNICERSGKTVVFITHQVSEAVFLSDRVAVMTARPGRIKEIVEIDLPRPRPAEIRRDPRAVAYEDRIWQSLRPEALQTLQRERLALSPTDRATTT